MNLEFDFTVNKENKTIRIKKQFAAEPELVWDAYTKPELLEQWWAPKPWKAKTKSMDFREGGFWHYAMVGPEGQEQWAKIHYKKIEPCSYYNASDSFMNADTNAETPIADWKVRFTSKGETTLVEKLLTFNDLATLEMVISMGFKEGMTMTLHELDRLLPEMKKKRLK